MKNNIHLKIMLRLGFVTLLMLPSLLIYGQEPVMTIVRSEQNAAQFPFIQSKDNANTTTYFIPHHVIGTGGVMNAISTNHFHSATAGETFVGGIASTNNYVLSGFWHLPGFGPTAVNQGVGLSLPTKIKLHQNYPNPFNPQTTIQYDLPNECLVTVEILNIIGQRVHLLLNEQVQGPGTMQVVWNSQGDGGRMLGSGIYLCRITVSSTISDKTLFQEIKKMQLVK